MRRSRWIGISALAATCVLVGTQAQASARTIADGAAGQPASRPHGTVKIIPLSADSVVDRTVVTASGARAEHEVNHLYRDGQGRTRHEAGNLVTINDPTTKTSTRLNVQTRTYQSSDPAQQHGVDGSAPTQSAADQPTFSPRTDLGMATVAGVLAHGEQYTITSPRPNAQPVVKKAIVWTSAQVQLPVRIEVTESTGQSYTQTYTNIRTGAEPAASLFAVPDGFRAGSVVDNRFGTQAACPLLNAPDPLVLFDFGSGVVEAVTDPQVGCIIAAHAWGFVLPLYVFPFFDPLPGIPYDAFGAYDTGLPCPFDIYPCAVPGDAAFLAFNGTDVTTKDSAIILTVFGF